VDTFGLTDCSKWTQAATSLQLLRRDNMFYSRITFVQLMMVLIKIYTIEKLKRFPSMVSVEDHGRYQKGHVRRES